MLQRHLSAVGSLRCHYTGSLATKHLLVVLGQNHLQLPAIIRMWDLVTGGIFCERIRNQENIRKSKFTRNIRDQQKTISSPRRSAATICVEHFLELHISNHVRCFARSIVDLQYTLANFYLVNDTECCLP